MHICIGYYFVGFTDTERTLVVEQPNNVNLQILYTVTMSD